MFRIYCCTAFAMTREIRMTIDVTEICRNLPFLSLRTSHSIIKPMDISILIQHVKYLT